MISFIKSAWTTAIREPITNALLILYAAFGGNLGIAIITLTVLFRVLLYPFMKSQFESTRKLKEIQPQIEKIKKKYKRNPQKAQEEQLKLYRKVGYNPLGCVFSIVLPFPILIAVYQAIRAFSANDISGIYGFVTDMVSTNGDISIDTGFLFWDLSKSYLGIAGENGYIALIGIPYLALALLTGASQYFSVKMNSAMRGDTGDKDKKKKDQKKDEEPNAADMMGDMGKSMQYMFPLITMFAALRLPSAVAIYWATQSWVTLGLQYAYNKLSERKKNGK